MHSGSTSSAGQISSGSLDRYLRLSLFLMVATGFGTLSSSGQLDLPTVILVSVGLVLQGYFLVANRRLVVPGDWNRPLVLGYAAFYFVDLFVLSRSFLGATVHLVLFGMMVKLFSAQRSRDHVSLALLSFAMILAAAVLTVNSTFFFAFSVFLLVAVAALILMEMQRSAAAADASVTTDPGTQRRLGWTVSAIAPVLLCLMLIGSVGIFLLLPRISVGYMGTFSPQSSLSTGFSNEVRLGRIGEIQQSSSAVMHVQFEGDNNGIHELKWRGVALRDFDGKVWSNPAGQTLLEPSSDGRYLIGSTLQPKSRHAARVPALLRYRVLLEALDNNVFFLADRPYSVSGNYRMVSIDSSGAVYNSDRERPVRAYEGESVLTEDLSNAFLGDTGLPYLQLPAIDPRTSQLALEITGKPAGTFEKAQALERYLRTHYSYTLQLPSTPPADPLANFLFERRRGHCEYFASAMAIMLRTIGIPSRVINGFRGGEFNDISGQYIIRASDAHSWVEAYFPEKGWIAFDPTPAGASLPQSRWGRLLLYVDAISSFWQEWVVNYDLQHQRTLGEGAIVNARSIASRVQHHGKLWYRELLRRMRNFVDSGFGDFQGWIRGGLAFVSFGILSAAIWLLTRWLRARRLRRATRTLPQQAASLWYERLQRWLGRRGWRREAQQTPQEFADGIPEAELRASVKRFTRHYEKARFGASGEDAERLPELYEEITAARKR